MISGEELTSDAEAALRYVTCVPEACISALNALGKPVNRWARHDILSANEKSLRVFVKKFSYLPDDVMIQAANQRDIEFLRDATRRYGISVSTAVFSQAQDFQNATRDDDQQVLVRMFLRGRHTAHFMSIYTGLVYLNDLSMISIGEFNQVIQRRLAVDGFNAIVLSKR